MRLIMISLLAAVGLTACDTTGTSAERRATSSFRAENTYLVYPTGTPNRFEVMGKGSASGTQYFCAAADYAYRRLGAGPADRVVLLEPVGPSARGGNSGFFRVAPRGTVESSSGITLSMKKAGQNAQIAHARNLCENPSIGFFGN